MKKHRLVQFNHILPWCASLPLLLGTWGYYLSFAHEEAISANVFAALRVNPGGAVSVILKSIYRAIILYGLSADESRIGLYKPGYWQLETARWIALFVTTSVFISIIHMATSRMSARLRTLRSDAVALHGDPSLVSLLRRELGTKAIEGTMPERFRARKHILAFQSEQSMYQYLIACHEQFFDQKKKLIYLCTLKASYPSNQDGGIFVSNMAENCARLYWEDRFLRKSERSVAILGFDEYGMALLTQALLVNVYREPREIRYTVYGDGAAYLSLHPNIGQFMSIGEERPGWDSLFFRPKAWEGQLDEIIGADRIIACSNSDEENLQMLDRLIERGPAGQIDVRVINAELPRRLWRGDEENIGIFGTNDKLYTLDVIVRESLLRNAKRIHACYILHEAQTTEACSQRKCAKRNVHCLECAVFRASWEKLGTFKQGSNIAQADHMSVKIREVLADDVAINQDAILRYKSAYELLKPSDRLRLMELEHNRWMRYHFINGWSYAPVRDDAHKRHNLLIGYKELSEDQWVKDEAAYAILTTILLDDQWTCEGLSKRGV